MNKEKEFEWTDELVSELLWSRFPFPEGVIEVRPILEEFKKLKEEVKPIVWTHNNDGVEINGISEGISFTLNDRLKVFYITKERLAEIIIAESKGMLNIIEPISSEDVKEYSKKEYLKFGEDCWKAARLKERILYNPNLQQQQNWRLQNQQQNCSYQAVDKYKTLSEYLNDKQKPK